MNHALLMLALVLIPLAGRTQSCGQMAASAVLDEGEGDVSCARAFPGRSGTDVDQVRRGLSYGHALQNWTYRFNLIELRMARLKAVYGVAETPRECIKENIVQAASEVLRPGGRCHAGFQRIRADLEATRGHYRREPDLHGQAELMESLIGVMDHFQGNVGRTGELESLLAGKYISFDNHAHYMCANSAQTQSLELLERVSEGACDQLLVLASSGEATQDPAFATVTREYAQTLDIFSDEAPDPTPIIRSGRCLYPESVGGSITPAASASYLTMIRNNAERAYHSQVAALRRLQSETCVDTDLGAFVGRIRAQRVTREGEVLNRPEGKADVPTHSLIGDYDPLGRMLMGMAEVQSVRGGCDRLKEMLQSYETFILALQESVVRGWSALPASATPAERNQRVQVDFAAALGRLSTQLGEVAQRASGAGAELLASQAVACQELKDQLLDSFCETAAPEVRIQESLYVSALKGFGHGCDADAEAQRTSNKDSFFGYDDVASEELRLLVNGNQGSGCDELNDHAGEACGEHSANITCLRTSAEQGCRANPAAPGCYTMQFQAVAPGSSGGFAAPTASRLHESESRGKSGSLTQRRNYTAGATSMDVPTAPEASRTESARTPLPLPVPPAPAAIVVGPPGSPPPVASAVTEAPPAPVAAPATGELNDLREALAIEREINQLMRRRADLQARRKGRGDGSAEAAELSSDTNEELSGPAEDSSPRRPEVRRGAERARIVPRPSGPESAVSTPIAFRPVAVAAPVEPPPAVAQAAPAAGISVDAMARNVGAVRAALGGTGRVGGPMLIAGVEVGATPETLPLELAVPSEEFVTVEQYADYIRSQVTPSLLQERGPVIVQIGDGGSLWKVELLDGAVSVTPVTADQISQVRRYYVSALSQALQALQR